MRAISFMLKLNGMGFCVFQANISFCPPEAIKADMLSLFLENDLDGQPCIEKK